MSNLKDEKYVLIVDDTPKNIQILATILNENNYIVKAATNGKQALQMIEKSIPDLILLDVMMPDLNGHETCKQLKRCNLTKDIPIIFLTAKVEAEDIIKGFEMGAVDYITKPFNSPELLARVKTHLELKKSKDLITKISQERKEFIHVLCHDLLNPISFVLTVFDMAEEDPNFLEEMKDNIKIAMQNGVNIINLVRTMIAIEDSKINLKIEPFNLKSLLNESLNILSQKLKNKNINLEISVADDLIVNVERVSFISSVINNILTNAIKFSFTNSK
ncbi:MAG: response regulator, partial [Spirochaetota bacterium]|nr:response regulator [Spirochaetota bacterium]